MTAASDPVNDAPVPSGNAITSTVAPNPPALHRRGGALLPGERHSQNGRENFGFEVVAELPERNGRAGVIRTPHGDMLTPCFTPVGTKATVKTVLPEQMLQMGAQALLANAYHLYVQPGPAIVDEAGGLGVFMNWAGPTVTDSGGFQVLSLGVGFKKVIAMTAETVQRDDVIADKHERLAHVDDDGVWFKLHTDGTMHRFSAEISMRIQHQLGADIMFAFDECTTLLNTRSYQERALQRTYDWALRCITEHERLTAERAHRPYQALFGVLQGAQYEDLRRKAARDLGALDGFDGFGLGGALDKHSLGMIVSWMTDELPRDKPRHLLGISEPDDLFAGVENGADTFDCVQPSRVARNAAIYSPDGRFNITNARFKRDFGPLVPGCACYTCSHYSRAYVHHLHKAKEGLASTLGTIHNEHFTVGLVAAMREHLLAGTFAEFKQDFLSRFYPVGHPSRPVTGIV
ncbi:tRNA guanosine(34) transglycosylase Tgt [Micrococcales bacterium 31B]|nr:tRNA guanosine(34) transglycosylase Tgt [Micrococcales bacterium 31B]